MSVDPPEVSAKLRQRLNVQFTFLSDQAGELLDRLNIRHRGGHEGNDIAFPAAILVDRQGVVRWVFESQAITDRSRPEEIFREIDRLG